MSGLLAFAVFLFLYMVLGVNPLGAISWITVLIPSFFLYFGVKKYRDEEKEGFLTFGQGFSAGMLFSLVYSSLSAMLILLFGSLVDVGFLDLAIRENLQALGEAKEISISLFGKAAYKEMLVDLEGMTLGQLAYSDLQSKLFGSLIIALVVAGILINRPPVLNEE